MEQYDPDDPVAIYIREVSKIELLSKDEGKKLFQELSGKGDWDETREIVARRLIESQLALVVSVAQKYSASGVSILELIQEGNLGLMNAVRSFAEKPIGDFGPMQALALRTQSRTL
jgi:DNA-directed RNA polymerase sigma subunit (sigma70/sigma32)